MSTFNDNGSCIASAAKLWEVVTDYASYPTFISDHQRTSCRPTYAASAFRLWSALQRRRPVVFEPLRYLHRYLVSVKRSRSPSPEERAAEVAETERTSTRCR